MQCLRCTPNNAEEKGICADCGKQNELLVEKYGIYVDGHTINVVRYCLEDGTRCPLRTQFYVDNQSVTYDGLVQFAKQHTRAFLDAINTDSDLRETEMATIVALLMHKQSGAEHSMQFSVAQEAVSGVTHEGALLGKQKATEDLCEPMDATMTVDEPTDFGVTKNLQGEANYGDTANLTESGPDSTTRARTGPDDNHGSMPTQDQNGAPTQCASTTDGQSVRPARRLNRGRRAGFSFRNEDYAFAEINKINPEKGKCYFTLMPEFSDSTQHATCTIEDAKQLFENPEVGMRCWLLLNCDPNEEGRFETVQLLEFGHRDTSVWREYNNLYRSYKPGDRMPGIVLKAERGSVFVGISPSIRVWVRHNEEENYEVDAPYLFRVKAFEKVERRFNLSLDPIDMIRERAEQLWRQVPTALSEVDVIVPGPIFANLDKAVEEQIKGENSVLNRNVLLAFLDQRYAGLYAKKRINIRYDEKRQCYYMDFLLDDTRSENGVPQSACFKRMDSDPPNRWTMSLLGFASGGARKIFSQDVFVRDGRKMMEELANKSQHEEWDYNARSEFAILKNYFQMAYYKSWLDGLIMTSSRYMVFNTGLVDENYDDIYGRFKRNSNTRDFWERRWEFDCFCTRYDKDGTRTNQFFAELPSPPVYFTREDYASLIFDSDMECLPNYEHIFSDNISRLPLEFIEECAGKNREVLHLITEIQTETRGKRQMLGDLYKLVMDDVGIRREMQRRFDTALMTARKYCRWNFKTAIPIYFPRENKISLLLPLKISTKTRGPADVALVTEKTVHGTYIGRTILTLEMAYNDARQVCRPNSEWLTVQNVTNPDVDERDYEEETD